MMKLVRAMRAHLFISIIAVGLVSGGAAAFANAQNSASAPGVGAVQGYQYVNKTFTPAVTGLNIGSVTCPHNEHVTGGGVAGNFVSGQEINQSYPFDGPDADHVGDDGWVGGVNNTSGSPQPFSVYAICRIPSS